MFINNSTFLFIPHLDISYSQQQNQSGLIQPWTAKIIIFFFLNNVLFTKKGPKDLDGF